MNKYTDIKFKSKEIDGKYYELDSGKRLNSSIYYKRIISIKELGNNELEYFLKEYERMEKRLNEISAKCQES